MPCSQKYCSVSWLARRYSSPSETRQTSRDWPINCTLQTESGREYYLMKRRVPYTEEYVFLTELSLRYPFHINSIHPIYGLAKQLKSKYAMRRIPPNTKCIFSLLPSKFARYLGKNWVDLCSLPEYCTFIQ